MDSTVKWIGGATAAVLLLFGGAMLAGNSLGTDKAETVPDAAVAAPAAAKVAEQAEKQPAPEPTVEDHFVIKRILPIEGPIKYGEWHWDDEDVPDGPLLITVDLDARVISVFKGGYEIGAAAVLLGTDDHPTPTGTFPIMLKKRHNISTIYGAPMPYTMRLTNDGVAIHASDVENGYASHGCIGTPDGFASRLFAIAKVGDKVVITRGKMVGLGDSLGG
ncbi:MAG: L,D-transpeptidase family protein [Caenibius sp.]